MLSWNDFVQSSSLHFEVLGSIAKNYFFIYFCLFFSRYKMSANTQQITHYQRNRDKILNKTKEYYQKNKEKRKEYRKNQKNKVKTEK